MSYDPVDDLLLDWAILQCLKRITKKEKPRRRIRPRLIPAVSQPPPRRCHFQNFYADLRRDPDKFHRYCRMTIPTFDRLLSDLSSGLTFPDTNMGRSITPEERLIVTLRFLSTGNSFSSLHCEFPLEDSAILRIIRLTCEVICQQLKEAVMPEPRAEDWLRIAEGFYGSVQFPNCVGALDGKHIRVKKPPDSGTQHFNNKQYFSVVLLALADRNLRFIMVDVEAFGSSADASIFRASRMGEQFRSNQLALPQPRPLPGSSDLPAPFVILADEGFELSHHVLRPFPNHVLDDRRRIFNYRLTRARRCVETALSFLTSKWQVLQASLQMDPEDVKLVIRACVILHNFVRIHDGAADQDLEANEPSSSSSLGQAHRGRPGAGALFVREQYTSYFMSPEGAVPWQMDAISGH